VAKYAIIFPVSERQKNFFDEEEIELAAKVAFVGHPPEGCTINNAQEFQVSWSQDLMYPGYWAVRVIGDVIDERGEGDDNGTTE
jgi:hypothetical protein